MGGMIVELPLPQPRAAAYHYYAFPLAVAQTRPDSWEWVACNFIQVEFDPLGVSAPVPFSFSIDDYAVNPLLDVMSMTLSWFERGNVVTSLREAVQDGWYVYAFFDEYHLPTREVHQIREYVHDALVHGYDSNRDVFLVNGYDDRNLLRSVWLKAEDVRRAFMSAMEKDPAHARVVMYRPSRRRRFRCDLRVVERTVDEYLRGFNTSEHFAAAAPSRDFLFGLDSYEPLKDGLSRDFGDGEFYNIRNVQVLWEHKRLMVERIEFLGELVPDTASVLPDLRAIESSASALKRSFLQHRYSGESVDRRAMSRMVDEIRELETRTLTRLLRVLARESLTTSRRSGHERLPG